MAHAGRLAIDSSRAQVLRPPRAMRSLRATRFANGGGGSSGRDAQLLWRGTLRRASFQSDGWPAGRRRSQTKTNRKLARRTASAVQCAVGGARTMRQTRELGQLFRAKYSKVAGEENLFASPLSNNHGGRRKQVTTIEDQIPQERSRPSDHY